MSDVIGLKAISSENGLPATKRAYEMITAGADTLDAVIGGVSLVEDDPNDVTVGYGGLPNEDGIVELDAAVMHGPTHRAGAVAALRNIRHPSKVAKLIMEQTDHVLLVGDGALAFARAMGFTEENLLTEKARKIWLYWKQTRSDKDDWLTPPAGSLDPEVIEFFRLHDRTREKQDAAAIPRSEADHAERQNRPTGTIHCAAINGRGEISCVTSTSGLAFKLAGRVGDSATIGAGLYVDREVGSCGSTGRGEANIENVSSAAAVELMRNGASPAEAGMEILRRVSAKTPDRLRDQQGRPNFNLKFYLLNRNGEHAGVSMWGPQQYALTDAKGTRLEACKWLYRR